jgi:transcriptional regulator with XRE-family HTH domain
MAPLPVRYPQFGERFGKLLRDKGWNATQLAAIAGDGKAVSYASIARLAKGQTRPRPALTARLAEILSVSPEELLGDDMPKSRKGSRVATPTKSATTPQVTTALTNSDPDSLEWKMARIIAIQQQLEAADSLRSELARLADDVSSELAKLKLNISATPVP